MAPRPSRRRPLQRRLRPAERLVQQLHPPRFCTRRSARWRSMPGSSRLTVGVFWVHAGAASSRRRTRAMRSPRSSFRPAPRSSAPTRCCKKAVEQAARRCRASTQAVMFAGFDGASGTQASNAGAAYVTFKPFDERAGHRPHRSSNHRERHARRAGRHRRGVRVRHPAARHPGHRQRRRLSHDGPGPQRRRAIRRSSRRPGS